MNYRFVEGVSLCVGGVRMRMLTPDEAERLVALGCVERPRRQRVRRLEVKAASRKVLPGFRLHTPTTYRERLLDGTARLIQHKGMNL